MSKLILLELYAAAGALLIVLSIPLMLRKIGPNRWYGFRTRRTLADAETWYAANADCGKRLAGAGLTIVLGAAIFYRVPKWHLEHYALACLTLTAIALAMALVGSVRFLNRFEQARKQSDAAINPQAPPS